MSDDAKNIAICIDAKLALQMVEAVGGETDDDGRFIFPDDTSFWMLEEALDYALHAMPTIVFDAMGTP
jgi:hypothetical protein